jgi:hypothetical protein
MNDASEDRPRTHRCSGVVLAGRPLISLFVRSTCISSGLFVIDG